MRITLSITLVALALLFFALAPAVAQEGPDENESNDTWDLADSISGLTIDGEIGRHGDSDDWYVLEGQEGYSPTITLTYDTDECDVDMEVYSGGGRDSDFVGSLTSTDSPDGDTFDIPDTCYLHVYVYDGDGEYSIDIEPGNEDSGNNHHNNNGDCEGPDEVESNDTYDVADLIEGSTIEGYACEGDDDWFVLNGQEGYNPTFTVTYDTRDCDIDVEVYSGSGRDRDLVGSLSSTDSPDSQTFNVEDTCYLHVFAYDGEGDYTIDIEAESTGGHHSNNSDCEGYDEVEPNDTENAADSIDSLTIEGYACPDDVDWFVLTGQEGRNPSIRLSYDDDECDIDLEIYSDDEYVGSLTSTSSPDEDDFRIPGECWIKVYCYDGEGDYTIDIEP